MIENKQQCDAIRKKIFGLAVVVCLALPVMASDGVYRTSSEKTHSSVLGADTVPTCVVVNNVRHMGIYLASAPSTELGREMRLSQGMVLLTVDGYSITTGRMADSWIGHRPAKKPLLFTYAIAADGKPLIQSGQIQSSASAATSASASPSGSSASSSPAAASQVSQGELVSYCLSMINESRKSGGLNPVQQDSSLAKFGGDYADYMAKNANRYDVASNNNPHMDMSSRGPHERAQLAGLSNFLDESIGRSSRSLGDMRQLSILHRQMMGDVHREIIMNPEAHLVGIGIARGPNRMYLVEEFSK